MTSITASMPTNIALIKYMGKKDSIKNIPDNSSLSYTLSHLISTVTLTPIDDKQDQWESDQESSRFIKHLDFLREKFQIKQYYKINSENNFPAGCGLASSASSFAALTECALKAFNIDLTLQEKAALSRQGSGSSCRSFFAPYALWRDEQVEPINLPYEKLIHTVVVVSKDKKLISSSEAHKLVQTSLLYNHRAERAENRLNSLIKSFKQKDWYKSYVIMWQEFWDMLALFETTEKPFSYLTFESLFVLNYLRKYWEIYKDGPLVTMDAGPNVHVLWREDQKEAAEKMKAFFESKFTVI